MVYSPNISARKNYVNTITFCNRLYDRHCTSTGKTNKIIIFTEKVRQKRVKKVLTGEKKEREAGVLCSEILEPYDFVIL